MARFSLNLDNINEDNSLLIADINVDPAIIEQSGIDSPLLVTPLEDVNGDEINDLFVLTSFSPVENDFAPENFVVFGGSSLPNTINSAEINGSNGFDFGNERFFASGSVEINRDGVSDLVITRLNLPSGVSTTKVIFGGEEFSQTVDINNLDDSNGVTISDSANSGVFSGISGDVTNDGADELVFSASVTADDSSSSVNKIVFGLEEYPAELDLADLEARRGSTIRGTATISDLGIDVNSDQFNDLIFNDSENPRSYVFFGIRRRDFPAEIDLTTLSSDRGLIIVEEAAESSDRFSGSLTEDLNGDGIGDIIIEKSVEIESEEETQVEADSIAVIYGSENNDDTFDLASVDGSNGFTLDAPVELRTTLDLNGDGLQDLLLRDVRDNRNYVIFGSDSIAANIELDNLDGSNGLTIENTNLNNNAGVVEVGDINGDGRDDISLDTQENLTYVLLGDEEFSASIDLDSPEVNAIAVDKETTNRIAFFSDINGDEIDDIGFNSQIDEENNSSASSTILFGDRDLSFATDSLEPEPEENALDTEIFRFQNNDVPGTYIYVGESEAQNIRENFNNFTEEGLAFNVAVESGDNLIPMYRFLSEVNPGTYLFVGESERENIREDFADSFTEEGLAFYTYSADSELGTDFSRFQNTAQPGTYLFATGEEKANIRENFPNFVEEGIAFSVEI